MFIKCWDTDVQKLMAMFDASYIDLFDTRVSNVPTQMVNFSTSAATTTAVQTSMLNVLDKGLSMAEQFITEQLVGK